MSNSPYELGWWLEIFTAQPPCIYYFGAFETAQEAEESQAGFVQDLYLEGTQGIATRLRFFQPTQLVVTETELLTHPRRNRGERISDRHKTKAQLMKELNLVPIETVCIKSGRSDAPSPQGRINRKPSLSSRFSECLG
ncbi:hypothetical protein TUMEXPCC7403_18760 [Tumidithrix helvetica PCC 7403]|uniref:DUF1816 domain-containing protein n=1 Tax=Tumidithrix helvetica TaxID=3457545 RepID=UPI003C8AD926